MDSFLPSEIGRLIYGYLISECDEELGETFLSTSKVMEECRLMKQIRGRKFNSKVQELSLTDILEQYSAVCSMVFKHTQKNECVHRNVPTLLENILKSRRKVRANDSLRVGNTTAPTVPDTSKENLLSMTVEEVLTSTPSAIRTVDENRTNVSVTHNEEPIVIEETVSSKQASPSRVETIRSKEASPSRVEPLASEQCATSNEIESYTSPVVTADACTSNIFSPTEAPTSSATAAITEESVQYNNNNSLFEKKESVCVVKLTDVLRCERPSVDIAKSNPNITESADVPRHEEPAPATKSKANNVCKKLRPKSDRLKAKPSRPTVSDASSLKRILPKPSERTLRNRITNNEISISCGKITELPSSFDKKEITNSPLNSLTVSPRNRLSNNSTPLKQAAVATAAAKANVLAEIDLESTKANANNKVEKEPWDLKLRQFLAQDTPPREPHRTPRKTPRKCKKERNPKSAKVQSAKKRKLEEKHDSKSTEKDQVCEVPTTEEAADKANPSFTDDLKSGPSDGREKELSPPKTQLSVDGVCDLPAQNIASVVENIGFMEADLSKSSCSDSVASTNLQVELCLEDEIVLFYKISAVS